MCRGSASQMRGVRRTPIYWFERPSCTVNRCPPDIFRLYCCLPGTSTLRFDVPGYEEIDVLRTSQAHSYPSRTTLSKHQSTQRNATHQAEQYHANINPCKRQANTNTKQPYAKHQSSQHHPKYQPSQKPSKYKYKATSCKHQAGQCHANIKPDIPSRTISRY